MDRSPRALVIEDDESIIDLVDLTLRLAGFTVDIASDAAAAIAAAKHDVFDIVIIDLVRPLIDGSAVCRRLRDEPNGAHDAKIVALTASSRLTTLEWAFAAGADAVIAKPFRASELVTNVLTENR
jgi:CheY-like chemotaxis protein